jgi:hypothetical protein
MKEMMEEPVHFSIVQRRVPKLPFHTLVLTDLSTEG